MSDFGTRIKTIRRKADLTQQEFADFLGINKKQTISDVENGKQKSLKDEHINLILSKYGISKSWLLLGEGDMMANHDSKVSQVISGSSGSNQAGRDMHLGSKKQDDNLNPFLPGLIDIVKDFSTDQMIELINYANSLKK